MTLQNVQLAKPGVRWINELNSWYMGGKGSSKSQGQNMLMKGLLR